MSVSSLDFWFEFASTYSYLSASRVRSVAAEAGVEVRWRPFLLGPIFAEQGLTDSPFNIYPVKGRYMWRDMERLCERYGLAFQRPTAFPRNGLRASRVACASLDAPWLPDFVVSVYEANFGRDLAIDDEAVLGALIDSAGGDANAALEASRGGEAKRCLRKHTEEAAELGIFGAPSFVVGEELFWGNDRLADAIRHAQDGN